MSPKFGTSGLRGLVVDLTEDLVADYVRAFIAAVPYGNGVFVGRDLRPSSPEIAGAAVRAVRQQGIDAFDCGVVATPALAMAAIEAGSAAIMVTGSHIPSDRNGLKFYTPEGEITKQHEADILAHLGVPPGKGQLGAQHHRDAVSGFKNRYISAFGQNALLGVHIGVYSHSTAGRDMLQDILHALGANVTELGRSEEFIPVDTEAVHPDVRVQLAKWAAEGSFHAIVSMDGDGDRPLLTDATGKVVAGDLLGHITARALGAQTVVTPVSSNTAIDLDGFAKVDRTRIGSPYVIAGMERAKGRTVGYEANGGFLLGFDAHTRSGMLPALMTRDSVLPIVATLIESRAYGVASLCMALPSRFTAADRLQEVPTEQTQKLVAALREDATPFLSCIDATLKSADLTDGLRMNLEDGRIVHLRPSGNAPEMRLYVEAPSEALAEETLQDGLSALQRLLGGQ